jgi:hypothetical protein
MSWNPVNFAQDAAAPRRQNGAMRRFLLLLLPLAGACQAGSLVDRGDRDFRLGNHAAALESYEKAAARAPGSEEIAARVARAQHFLVESRILDLMHGQRPLEALELVDRLEPGAPADRLPVLAAYRERAGLQMADLLDEAGYQANEESMPEEAARLFTEALAWNPDLVSARERLAKTEDLIATKARIGEEYYFEGMDHLREDQGLRARTSFMHASTLLGEDSLAESRLAGLTEDLAEESLNQARLFLEADMLGQAWVAIQDASSLRPEHEETSALGAVIRDRVKREALMTGAEVAVRGGRTEIGDEILREILELELAGSDRRIADLAERNQDAKNSSRYNRARAYELDRQLVSAAALYQSILDDEAGFGWEDVELRLSTISGRLAEAAAAYARAMDAEQAGDEEGYRAALAETVQASVDYADALARLRALHMEQAALESDS